MLSRHPKRIDKTSLLVYHCQGICHLACYLKTEKTSFQIINYHMKKRVSLLFLERLYRRDIEQYNSLVILDFQSKNNWKNETTHYQFLCDLMFHLDFLIIFLNVFSSPSFFKTRDSSRPKVFCKRVPLKISQNSQKNTCAKVSF